MDTILERAVSFANKYFEGNENFILAQIEVDDLGNKFARFYFEKPNKNNEFFGLLKSIVEPTHKAMFGDGSTIIVFGL